MQQPSEVIVREPSHFAENATRVCDMYCAELRRWLDTDITDESALYHAGRALCEATRLSGVPPEQILVALHARGLPRRGRAAISANSEARRERRYVYAVDLLMRTYFEAEAP